MEVEDCVQQGGTYFKDVSKPDGDACWNVTVKWNGQTMDIRHFQMMKVQRAARCIAKVHPNHEHDSFVCYAC